MEFLHHARRILLEFLGDFYGSSLVFRKTWDWGGLGRSGVSTGFFVNCKHTLNTSGCTRTCCMLLAYLFRKLQTHQHSNTPLHEAPQENRNMRAHKFAPPSLFAGIEQQSHPICTPSADILHGCRSANSSGLEATWTSLNFNVALTHAWGCGLCDGRK